MTLEVGTSVQKVLAMTIGGIGGLLLIGLGHYEAGIAILSTLIAFAVGDANGEKRAKARQPEELPPHRL